LMTKIMLHTCHMNMMYLVPNLIVLKQSHEHDVFSPEPHSFEILWIACLCTFYGHLG
jgi:hypothetical protein